MKTSPQMSTFRLKKEVLAGDHRPCLIRSDFNVEMIQCFLKKLGPSKSQVEMAHVRFADAGTNVQKDVLASSGAGEQASTATFKKPVFFVVSCVSSTACGRQSEAETWRSAIVHFAFFGFS